jgi:hypothetical protein
VNSLHSFSSFRSQLNVTISLPKHVSRKTHALHTVDAIYINFSVSNNGSSKQELNVYYWYAAGEREIRNKFEKSKISSKLQVPETKGRKRKIFYSQTITQN